MRWFLIIAICGACFASGYTSAKLSMQHEINKTQQDALIANDRIAKEYLISSSKATIENEVLRNEIKELSKDLSTCQLDVNLVRKYEQLAKMSSASNISNTDGRIVALNQESSAMSCHELSQTATIWGQMYLSCASKYNSLLKILGY